jgi:hypothetical protein
MKKQLNYLFFAGAALLFVGCSKDNSLYENVYEEAPAFYIKGLLEGDSLNLSAGTQGYSLNTDFILDSDSVLTLRGRMERPGIAGPSFSIWFRTEKRGPASLANFNVNSEFQRQSYALSNNTPISALPGAFSVQATATSNGATTYQWSGDGSIYAGNVANITVNNLQGALPISLVCNYGTCTSEVTHYIDPVANCDGSFSLDWLSDHEVSPKVSLRGNATPSKVEWFVNDSLVTLANGNIQLPYGVSTVIACKLYFANGCEKRISRRVTAIPSYMPGCSAEFVYSVQPQTTSNPMQLGTVEFVYTDENGKRYTSKHNAVGGFFTVHSINDYRANGAGYPTKRYTFSASAELKATDGSTLKLNKLFGHFAFAYPD